MTRRATFTGRLVIRGAIKTRSAGAPRGSDDGLRDCFIGMIAGAMVAAGVARATLVEIPAARAHHDEENHHLRTRGA